MSDDRDYRKHRRIKLYLSIALIFLLVATIFVLILLIFLFKDKNRSTYVRRNLESSEIVKKNYIDGFSDTKSNGKFSYVLPEDDINELLAIGKDSLEDKHIENIYFNVDDSGVIYFNVDLTKVFIKTRVVITTIPEVKDSSTITLKIYSCKVGRVNALSFCENKGYLTSQYLNSYFSACHLPITYDESNYTFEIKPYSWTSQFPSTEIGNQLLHKANEKLDIFSFNHTLFGFDIDISKFKTSNLDYIDVNTSNIPDLSDEILTGCEENYSSMVEDETKTIYSLNEEVLNKLVKSSFVSTQKEEVKSTLTKNELVFDIKGANIHINEVDKINLKIFVSINGYLIDIDTSLKYASSSLIAFKANFLAEPITSSIINKAFENIFSCLSTKYSYLAYQTSNKLFAFNFEGLNTEFSDPILKHCSKLIELDPISHSIEFKIIKD